MSTLGGVGGLAPSNIHKAGVSTTTAKKKMKQKHTWTEHEKRNTKIGLLFISPWIIGFLVFTIYPIIYSTVISFTRYSGMNKPEFIGLQNYKSSFTDPLTIKSVENTLIYAAMAVPLGLVVALLLAFAMNKNVREVALYRTALYVPSLVPAFAMSFIFIVFTNPTMGLFNIVLGWFGVANSNLLGDPMTAKIVMVVMAQLGAGNAALIYLAGLHNIPATLYESARVDGAGPLRQFFSITLPLLTPTILFNLITGISGALQIFTQSFIMTNGGPDNGTLFYMLYLYNNAFGYAQLGYASAMALLLFIFGILLAYFVYWVSQKFVNYDVSAD